MGTADGGYVDRIVVNRSGPLEGEVRINGAKNSVLKLMAASVLAPGTYVLRNVPRITDVDIMADVLRAMGLEVTPLDPGELEIIRPDQITPEARSDILDNRTKSWHDYKVCAIV